MSERKTRKILLAVDGSEASKSTASIISMVYCDSQINPVHVIAVPRNLPLDSEMIEEAYVGEQVLTDAEERISEFSRRNVNNGGELLQARKVAPAIIDEAKETNFSTIALGADTGVGNVNGLGSTARYVLNNFRGEVILFRGAKRESDITSFTSKPKVIHLKRLTANGKRR